MHTSTAQFIAARDFLLHHRTDWQAARSGFVWPQFSHFNWALDYFDVMAQGNPRTALTLVEEDGSVQRFTFDELHRQSNQAANWFRHLGIARGDRVLLMLGNQRELWVAMLGLMKIGAVMIPTTLLLEGADLQDRLSRGEVKHILCAGDQVHKFQSLAQRVTRMATGRVSGWHAFDDHMLADTQFTPTHLTPANAPLLLYFTSGTTSKPKLVLHTHQSYPVGHLSTMYWIGLREDDLHLNISSPGWAKHAWSCFFAPWNAGAGIFIYNYTRFNAKALLDTLVQHGVTTLCAPPTVWRMLIQENLRDWPVKLRELVGAGEPLNPEVIEQVRAAWGLTIRDGFGQSETTCQIGNPPGQPVKAGSMGRPLPGYPVVLIGPDGQPAREGELCLDLRQRPLGLMQGYFGDEAKTAEAMRDGFYHTGDVASQDDEGYITYVGRSDDVFKSSDYRLSPFELESVLIEHPDVMEAAVVPSPDPQRLSVPKAFVVLRQGVPADRETALSILRFSRAHLSPYKRIRRIEFAELPKTISGKIQRNVLRQQEAEHEHTQAHPPLAFREEDFSELRS